MSRIRVRKAVLGFFGLTLLAISFTMSGPPPATVVQVCGDDDGDCAGRAGADIRFGQETVDAEVSTELGFSGLIADIACDEREDLIVGAPLAAKVYVFCGRPGNPETVDDLFGSGASGERSLFLDERADYIVTGDPGTLFGFAVAVGDEGLAVGAPSGNGQVYLVPRSEFDSRTIDVDQLGIKRWSWDVGPGRPDADAGAGYAVTFGDVSGSPAEELIAGDRSFDHGRGRILVFNPLAPSTPSTPPTVSIQGREINEGFGESLVLGRFLDPDEAEPLALAVGSVGSSGGRCSASPATACTQSAQCPAAQTCTTRHQGRVYVFNLPGAGGAIPADARCLQGESLQDFFGYSVSSGNFVGAADSLSELVVGAIYADRQPAGSSSDPAPYGLNTGAVYVFKDLATLAVGECVAIDTPATAIHLAHEIYGRNPWDEFGFALSQGKLYDDDQYDDLIVTARWHDTSTSTTIPVVDDIDSGAAYVLDGNGGWPSQWTVQCAAGTNCTTEPPSGVTTLVLGGVHRGGPPPSEFPLTADEMGFAVAGGDLNGDGFDDLVVTSLTHEQIYFLSIQQVPIAADDAATTDTNEQETVDVLENDEDPNFDPLTIRASSVTAPSFGLAEIVGGSILYTPDDGYRGNDSFTYQVQDNATPPNVSGPAEVTITVENAVPVANDDSATTPTNTPVNVNVLANDTDLNLGNPDVIPLETLTIVSVTAPAIGTAAIDTNGTAGNPSDDFIRYTPDPGYRGPDTFTYTIRDAVGATDTATVSITVLNAPPIANDDSATTPTNAPVNVNVLANDTDLNLGNPDVVPLETLTIVSVTAPMFGTAAIDTNGTAGNPSDDFIRYTPDPGYRGPDTFTYTIRDGAGATDPATVSITVLNAPPIANDDSATTPTNTPVNVNVLANDTDLNLGNPDVVPLETLTIVSVTVPTIGTAAIDTNGTAGNPSDDFIRYTPDPGYRGPDTFTYTIRDAVGATDTATVSITVLNAPPVAVNNAVPLAVNAPAIDIDVLGNDTDLNIGNVDVGPPLEDLTIDVLVVAPSNGTATIERNGTLLDPTDDFIRYVVNADFQGNDTFRYQISDRASATAIATVTISVENSPPVAVDDAVTTPTNSAINVLVLANDDDLNDDTLSILSATAPANGTVLIRDNGTPGNTADDFIQYTPDTGFRGTDTFNYTIEDGRGGLDDAQVTVDVANAVPVAGDDSALTQRNQPVSIDVLDNDTDLNIGNVAVGEFLTIVSVTNPPNGSAIIDNNGTAGNPADDFVRYTPDPGYNGPDSFNYTIEDENPTPPRSDTGTVTITVNAPPNGNPNAAATRVNRTVDIAVLANDNDADGDPLAITATNPGVGQGTVVVHDNGTPGDTTDDVLRYTPPVDADGVFVVSYTVADDNGGVTSGVAVTVTVTNDQPIAVDDDDSTPTNVCKDIDVLGNDVEPNGKVLTILSVTNPPNGDATIDGNGTAGDPSDDFIRYCPDAGFAGLDSFSYTIRDVLGLQDSAVVDVTVFSAPPEATDDLALVLPGQSILIPVLANDFDLNNDPLEIVTIVSGPSNGTATIDDNGTPTDTTDDRIFYEPFPAFIGNDSLVYRITDNQGLPVGTDDATVSIRVNTPPMSGPDSVSTPTDTPVNISVLSNDVDPDGHPLTLTELEQPANGTATIENNGTPGNPADDFVRYTPNPTFKGLDPFQYRVQDILGAYVLEDVTVTVLNAPPLASDDSATTATDTAVDVNVLGNDTDANLDPLRIVSVTPPASGTATVEDNGTAVDFSDDFVRYTPNPGFTGTDEFTYTISDGEDTDSATVSVTVENADPSAEDDAVTTPTDTAVDVDVLDNDTDANNDPLTIVSVTAPSNGTATIEDDGTPADPSDDFVRYTPNLGYRGPDEFGYTIEDGRGGSDSATVTVTVENASPVADDDGATTPTDTAVDVDVLDNDTDANSDPLTIVSVTTPSNGTATIENGGTPGDPSDDFIRYTPQAGFRGADFFSYMIEDGAGGSSGATVNVIVQNAPPEANDDSASTPAGSPVDIDVLDNDTDANGDPLTIVSVTQPSEATVTIEDNGTPVDPSDDFVRYTPNTGLDVVGGSDSFGYTIEDGAGGSDSANVTITFGAVGPVADDDGATTPTNTAVDIPVLANDTDANDDPLTIVSVTAPANGTATIEDNGTAGDPSDDFIRYTPNLGFRGLDTFEYTIDDGQEGSDTGVVTVTVENAPPVAVDDGATTPTDTAVDILVLGNDTDANNDALTIVSVTSPSNGAATIEDNGTAGDPSDDFIRYTPNPGYRGPDGFGYTIEDGAGGSDSALVALTVENAAPVADDDSVSTPKNTPVDIIVLSNDTDANYDPLTIVSFTNPVNGTATIQNNGTAGDPSDDFIRYTPDPGYRGPDGFGYTIADGAGGSDSATVTVTVENVAPEAADDGASTPTNTPVDVNVLANDTDTNNDPLTIVSVTTPANGTATIEDNGTAGDPSDDFVRYTPDLGFTGIDSFTYTIEDGQGGSDTATVTVTVDNAPPVANDDSDTTPTDTVIDINVLANDTDANNDPLTIVSVTAPSDGTATIEDNGTAGDPSDDFVRYTPDLGFAGIDSFTYTIEDGQGGSDTATVTVTVDNAPPVAADDGVTTPTDTPVDVSVLANDTDANNDPLTIVSVTAPANGTATIEDNGTAGDPSDDFVRYTPDLGFTGIDTFTYTIEDGQGGSDTATVTVTVDNAPPVAVDDSATTPTDTAVDVDVLANDTDANSDPLAIVSVIAPANGTATIDNNGTPGNPSDDFVRYTPDLGFSGIDTFTYTIEDGQGGSDTATVTVTVENAPPVANDDADTTTTDTTVDVNVLANDLDANNDPLTIVSVTAPANGTATIEDNGTAGDPSDDFVRYTPDLSFTGIDTFTYTIEDGQGGSDTATVTVTVDNAPPVANDDSETTPTDTAVDVTVLDNDADANGDPLTIVSVTAPANGTATIDDNRTPGDPSDDFVRYTPDLGFAGIDTFTYTIEDGQGGSDTGTVTVTVDNAPPVANDDSATTPTDTAVDVTVLDNDTDANSDPLAIVSVTAPANGTATIEDNGTPGDPSDDFVRYTPDLGFAGIDTFTYTIEDGQGGSDTGTVTVTVDNAPPVANDDSATTPTDTAVDVTVLDNDADANGDPLTIVSVTAPANGTATIEDNGTPGDPSDDFVRYTPDLGFRGIDVFDYTIEDGQGGSDTGAVTVTVDNAPPVANDDTESTPTDTAVDVNVLANDTDANSDPLTIVSVTAPSDGTATIEDNGTAGDPSDDFVRYTPDLGFTGIDTFTYTIEDGAGGSDTATVTVETVTLIDRAKGRRGGFADRTRRPMGGESRRRASQPSSAPSVEGPSESNPGSAADSVESGASERPLPSATPTDRDSDSTSGHRGQPAVVRSGVVAVLPMSIDLANGGDPAKLVVGTAPLHGIAWIEDFGTPLDVRDDVIRYRSAAEYCGEDRVTVGVETISGAVISRTVWIKIECAYQKR